MEERSCSSRIVVPVAPGGGGDLELLFLRGEHDLLLSRPSPLSLTHLSTTTTTIIFFFDSTSTQPRRGESGALTMISSSSDWCPSYSAPLSRGL